MYNLESLTEFVNKALTRRQQLTQRSGASIEPMPDVTLRDAEGAGDGRAPAPTPSIDAAWSLLEEISREDQVTTGIVTGWNRGGLLVRWAELQGFVPASQLKEVPLFEGDGARDDKLSRWVGEELNLKVIELDRSRNRLVFSERATIWGPKDGERLLAEIRQGDVYDGYVSNLCDFGAFVDLGGIDGLIHISELSWGRVTHPSQHLQLGQKVRVFVLSVDRVGHHVGLSIKRLLPNPWSVVEEKYAPNDIVAAAITNVVDFGAFAQIEEGLEGLIHISELAEEHIQHPGEVVTPGDKVRVRILRIDAARHRLSLSMRSVAPALPPALGHEQAPAQG
jgi:small subunit ribosomal protein S1